MFTAQLGVRLIVTPTTLKLTASGREFVLQREYFQGLEEVSLLGLFKRGLHLRHHQPNLADPLVFYPAGGRDQLRQQLDTFGWT